MLQGVKPQLFNNRDIPNQPIIAIVATPVWLFQHSNPSIVHLSFMSLITACNLNPQDLPKLEASGDYLHLRMEFFNF